MSSARTMRPDVTFTNRKDVAVGIANSPQRAVLLPALVNHPQGEFEHRNNRYHSLIPAIAAADYVCRRFVSGYAMPDFYEGKMTYANGAPRRVDEVLREQLKQHARQLKEHISVLAKEDRVAWEEGKSGFTREKFYKFVTDEIYHSKRI